MLPTPAYLGREILGKYQLHRVVNLTSEGFVYAGIHKAMERPVEVTLVDLSRELGAEQLAGFDYCSRAASSITHPATTRIYDFGRHEDEFLYRVEESVEGTTLFSLYGDRGCDEFEPLLALMVRLTEVLAEIHEQGRFHLRLTPSDLVLAGGKILPEALRLRHFAGLPWGESPPNAVYAAPEQFGGDQVGAAADVYQVGLVLWYCLVGTPAAMSALMARSFHLSPQPSKLPPGTRCPPQIRDVVHKALAKPREERYSSMQALHQALRAILKAPAQRGEKQIDDQLLRLQERTPFPLPGQRFAGTYEIEKMVGSGGFARVFAAREAGGGPRVAIKILWHPCLHEATNDSTVRRFQREARIVSILQSPHTVSLIDFGTTEQGLLFQVFEYIEGPDLKEWLGNRGPVEDRMVIDVARQLLRSLHEAHQHGVLHRDIKPANIMVVTDGDSLTIKLVDFGIAKVQSGVFDDTGTDLTQTGMSPGTPRYMSPEQLFGNPLGPPSDLYSLGLVLWEMCIGRPAIAGETTYEIVANHLRAQQLWLPESSGISPAVIGIINGLLHRDPKDRFQSASEVLTLLRSTPLSESVQ